MVWLLTGIGHGLRESAYMLWETLWALVLGFVLSGVVQAFSSRSSMVRYLGDHRPAAIGRASFLGMISSSCSYAASALARSLFAKGADFVSAMVFMFASTNLVIELGLVLAVLLGWSFVAAQFAGGLIMIGLLALAGTYLFRGRLLAEAKARQPEAGDHGGAEPPPAGHHGSGRRRWVGAAGYTVADLTMLRKEMAIGFTAGGFLAALVPVRAWNDLFLHGHGWWTTLENVAVGPFVAVISFVCSVGNVPLAAALWYGGISFGGVISFVFADLITLPLLLVYRKQYGGRMAGRMLLVFWAVMSSAGLATQYLFASLGALPRKHTALPTGGSFRWDHTTWLDIAALFLLAGIVWVSRRRPTGDSGSRYAIDPICGMQVEKQLAPAISHHDGDTVYFCSEHCQHRFDADRPAPLAGSGS